ncbi:AAA family ATPase [Marinovum sp.]|uniref:AAA family ATPase n=1 Tax=Marinovum sp. TaxID=2024839 RepID=UPI003A925D35
MTAPVIHLCGWPGSGKATIGRCLAAALGGRLIDNHLMLDPASALFDRSDPRHARLREGLRRAIYDAARGLPEDVALVVTDALAETERDRQLFAPTEALAQARGAPLLAVTLAISPEENLRRLTDPPRQARSKLTDPDVLTSLRADHRLLRPAGAITVDVTDLSAEEAATAILGALSLQRATDA